MKLVRSDGGRAAAGFAGTGDDCVCRAIALAAPRPYAEVYSALAEGHATQRRSKRQMRCPSGKPRTASHGIDTTRRWFKGYMMGLGFAWTPTMAIGIGCTVHLADGELPDGRLVVLVSRHVVAVIDSVIFDRHDPRRDGRRCVYGFWRKVV